MEQLKSNAFGHIVPVFEKPKKAEDDYHKYLVQLKVKPDLDHPGETIVDTSDKLDLQKLINSYKDDCGFEYMMRQIKSGQATLADFCDDGKHGADVTGIPEYIGDVKSQLVDPKVEQNEQLLAALGIDPKDYKGDEALEKAVVAALKEIAAKAAAAKQTEEVKENA